MTALFSRPLASTGKLFQPKWQGLYFVTGPQSLSGSGHAACKSRGLSRRRPFPDSGTLCLVKL